MNLNKLFPRLSIRAKLGIAFALVALVPLAAVAAITTRVTIARLRDAARSALEREVSTARSDAEQSLGRVEQDVVFLADAFLRTALVTGTPPQAAQAFAIHEFLDHAPFLFRIKTIAEDGTQVYATSGSDTAGEDQSSGDYYVWRARALAPTERLLMPVEVRGTDAVSGQGRPVPAVAVILPVRDSAGRFLGAVVGEAYAATLFASLELVAPSFGATTTGLVDEQHRFLYHSTQKRNWESLLGIGMDSALVGYLGSGRLVEGEPFRTDDLLVSAERIRLGSSGGTPLTLFRAVPLTEINAPVREFLVWVVATGVALLGAVLAIALVAARQLTSPIYQLRDAASRLTRGQQPPAITIDTNDELEDLAADFGQMATALLGQQRALEQTVTDRTRELQQTHAELADVLAHSADAIVGLDPAGRIRVWNRGAETLFGYRSDEVAGVDPDLLLRDPARDDRTERAFVRRELSQKGAVIDFKTERRTKAGAMIPVSITQTPLRDGDGRLLGTSLIFRDTSLQTTLEQHMRRSERLGAMSVMAAGLAHELNNPLAIIGNRIECMELELRDLDQPELVRDLGVLRDHATRITRLTQDLLRFAREPSENLEALPLHRVADRVVQLVERTLAGRNVRISLAGDPAPHVFGADHALETVCLNLVLNAADAMPGGGPIDLEVERRGEDVTLTVADQGTGVPADLKERVFESFFTTKGQKGTGLGLSLCRSIVERHGGRIWVEDGHPCGSRFVVSLPHYQDASG